MDLLEKEVVRTSIMDVQQWETTKERRRIKQNFVTKAFSLGCMKCGTYTYACRLPYLFMIRVEIQARSFHEGSSVILKTKFKIAHKILSYSHSSYVCRTNLFNRIPHEISRIAPQWHHHDVFLLSSK